MQLGNEYSFTFLHLSVWFQKDQNEIEENRRNIKNKRKYYKIILPK